MTHFLEDLRRQAGSLSSSSEPVTSRAMPPMRVRMMVSAVIVTSTRHQR